jgi:hypothetical protein
MGREKLLVVSVGTGRVRGRTPLDRLRRFPSALLAVHSLKSLIADTGVHSEQVLQWMGACPAPWRINSEVEFAAGSLPEEAKLLTYLRFDVRFDADYLRGTLDLDLPIERAAALERLDAAEAMDDMIEIGRRAAALQVEDRLLPEVFDPRSAGQAAQ